MVSSINSKINARKIWISLPNVTSGADLGDNHIKLLKRPEIIGVILFSDNLDKSLINKPKEAFLSIKSLIKSIPEFSVSSLSKIKVDGLLLTKLQNAIKTNKYVRYFLAIGFFLLLVI